MSNFLLKTGNLHEKQSVLLSSRRKQNGAFVYIIDNTS